MLSTSKQQSHASRSLFQAPPLKRRIQHIISLPSLMVPPTLITHNARSIQNLSVLHPWRSKGIFFLIWRSYTDSQILQIFISIGSMYGISYLYLHLVHSYGLSVQSSHASYLIGRSPNLAHQTAQVSESFRVPSARTVSTVKPRLGLGRMTDGPYTPADALKFRNKP